MFENRIALVTGGTSGIGKKIAEELLKEGVFVFINYHSDDSLASETKNELKKISSKLEFIKADISNEEDVLEMMKNIKERKGHLDYLVNNAGTNVDAFIEDADLVDFKRVVDTNFIGKVI
ncbi:MAG: SDR family oxidoreductase, partial [Bacilli bacterium]|nr:SDR family oxidoreductase [Bacilli bacterium]